MRVHPAYPSRTSLSRLLRARLSGVARPIKEKNQRQIAAGRPIPLRRGALPPAFAKATAGNLAGSGWRANRSCEAAKVGAGDGNRTHDTQLGKLMFYH